MGIIPSFLKNYIKAFKKSKPKQKKLDFSSF